MTDRPSKTAVAAAYAAVYVIWGSTYLAMRVVVQVWPPFLTASLRFLIAGVMLYVFLRARGTINPSRAEWKSAALIGALLLVGGNGMVMWAEQFVASSLAALLIATVPLWIAVLDRLLIREKKLGFMRLIGLAVGFAGVVVLVWNPNSTTEGNLLLGTAALLFAAFSWAVGSQLSRWIARPASAMMQMAQQMLAGGAMLLVLGLVLGETDQLVSATPTWEVWAAMAFLIFAGSLVGYTCYMWILRVSGPAKASTYAYVNPLVAIVLGVTLLDEPFNMRIVLGAAAIILAVIVIMQGAPKSAPPTTAAVAAAPIGARPEPDSRN